MARPLIVTEMLSLDGVMEGPGGGDHPRAGWTFRDIDFVPEAYELKGREQEEAGALLLGRRTFEEFAPVWPSMDDQFARYNHQMPKYVVSTTLTDDQVAGQEWEDCRRLSSLEEVRALRDQGSEDDGAILVHGSAQLAQSLAAADLVDRYHLLTFPVVLGTGKRLFAAEGEGIGALTVLEDRTFSNGIRASVLEVVRDQG